MVYSGGVRFVVQAAAVCALVLSAFPSIQAKGVPPPAPKQNQVVCSASDGDKSFGVQAIKDNACTNGGLGCYSKHCRYCKVLDTPKSSHLDTCLSYGVAFTSTTTVAVTQGPCQVSSGDVAAGISAVTDSGCLYGGVGCFNDHCRFCKVVETPQSTGFMACSSLDSSYSVPVVTVAPTTAAPTVPTTVAPATAAPTVVVIDVPTTLAPAVVDPVTEAPTIATPTPTDTPVTGSTCSVVPSAGDVDAGVNIVTDLSCASGGLGCLSDVCRFCKVKTTQRSDTYLDCALVNGATLAPTTTTVAPGATTETPSVTPAVTEAPDTIVPDVTTEAPVDVTVVPASTTGAPDVTTEAPTSTTEAPVATTEAPVIPTEVPDVTTATPTTDAPVVTTEVPVSTTENPAPATTCTLVASAGDAEIGISVATDSSCSSGGVGCIDDICRFCKLTTSLQSAPYIDCALLIDGSPKSEAPAVDITVSPSEMPNVTTEAPTATTETPVTVADTPDASTEAPTTATNAPDATTETPTDGTDVTTEPPLVTETPGTTTGTPVVSTETPVSISTTLPAQETCGIMAAAGDIAVGVHIATDPTCSTGGAGCINDLCRFCKVETTTQSAAFVDCTSLSGFTSDTASSGGATTPSPVVVTNSPVTPATCDLVASPGDAAVGIRVITDSTCSAGGIGCISDVCRFCKVITSVQSAAFIDCVTVDGYTLETEAPTATTASDVTTIAPSSEATCTQIASDGDLAVGVDITTDVTCVSGGVGCIDNVCRFCQVTATVQSAAFANCTLYPDYSLRSEAPADANTTPPSASNTDTPVAQASCGLVVSAGDAAVGISITSDATCAVGGAGCIDSVCRFCKVMTTVQSAAFVDCTSITGFVPDSDVPAATTTPPTDSVTSTDTSAPAASCGLVISEGDAAVGIDITADTTCQFGGVGCIDNVCRFCKVRTTEQSAAFVDCPMVTSPDEPVISTPAPSDTTSDASSSPADTSEIPVDTTVPPTTSIVDVPLPVTEAPGTSSDTSDLTTDPDVSSNASDTTADAPTATSATIGSEAPSVAADADEPTDATELPQDNTSDSGVEGSDDNDNDMLTESPPAATNVSDTSDLLTEAPVTTTESPTNSSVPTVDDDDSWEGSDEASEADSGSTYYDSEEYLDGI